MIKNTLLLTVILFCFSCASNSADYAIYQDDNHIPGECIVPINSTHIDLFEKCNNYDNNLSYIASEIKFVKLDNSQNFDNFFVDDIALSDEYIFLQFMDSIKKYDRDGNFIKNIGKHGRRSKEFRQLAPPMNIDYKQELIYATDIETSRMFAFNFDGILKKRIKLGNKPHTVDLIAPERFASRQGVFDKQSPNCYLVQFYDLEGNTTKICPSNIYPIPDGKGKYYGAYSSLVWNHDNKHYMLEFGSDTIFQFLNDSLIFSRTVGGEYRMTTDEKDIAPKDLEIYNGMMRPNNGVFESDKFLIFRLYGDLKLFYKIYNKLSGAFHQTKHEDYKPYGRSQNHAFFTDNIVSGLNFRPDYQSLGKAIGFVSSYELLERKDEVLEFIKNHPSDEGNKLKAMINNLDSDSGNFLMIVKFK